MRCACVWKHACIIQSIYPNVFILILFINTIRGQIGDAERLSPPFYSDDEDKVELKQLFLWAAATLWMI